MWHRPIHIVNLLYWLNFVFFISGMGKAKLLEGPVAMDVHWGLEHDEIEQGYILTCQAYPLTDKILIDFDTR